MNKPINFRAIRTGGGAGQAKRPANARLNFSLHARLNRSDGFLSFVSKPVPYSGNKRKKMHLMGAANNMEC